MYGRTAVLPAEVQAIQCEDASCKASNCDFDASSLEERLRSVADLKDVVYPKVSSNIDLSQARQRQDYNKRQHNKASFQIGDHVLLCNSKRADRKGGKSVDPWSGPYDIYMEVGKGLYPLKNPKSSQVLKKKSNACNMKHYRARVDDAEGNEDVEVIGTQEQYERLFIPSDGAWRKSIATKLGVPFPKGRLPRRRPGILSDEPSSVDSVLGDGSCLFRALPKEITGTENHHKKSTQCAGSSHKSAI